MNAISPAKQAEVLSLLRAGKSVRAIAKKTGVNRNTVWRYAQRNGIAAKASSYKPANRKKPLGERYGMSEIGRAVEALRAERVGLVERVRMIDQALETLTPLVADDSEPIVLSAKSQRHIVRGAQSSPSNESAKSEPADGVSVYQRQSDGRWCGTVELPGGRPGKRRRKYFYADGESAVWTQIENWRDGLRKAEAGSSTRVVSVEEPYVPKEPVDVEPPEITVKAPAPEEPDEDDDEPRAIKLDWAKEFRLDTIRARIVKLLGRYGPRSAVEIASQLGLNERAVEEPLTILHEGGILKLDKDDYRLVVNIPYLTEARA